MTSIINEGVKTLKMKDLLLIVVCDCCGTIYKQSRNYKLMDNETSLIFGKGVLAIRNSAPANQVKCGTCGFEKFEIHLARGN